MVVASPPETAERTVRADGAPLDVPATRVDAGGRGRPALITLVEPGLHDARLAKHLLDAAAREFARGRSRSTTAALTDALQAANAALYEENRRALTRDQRRLGGLCAALKGETLYVAQTGGAATWLCRAGRARLLRGGEGGPRPKLGAGAWLDPELVSAQLQPGDYVLFTSAGLLVTGLRLAQAIAGLEAEDAADAALELQQRAGARDPVALVVLRFEAAHGPATASPVSGPRSLPALPAPRPARAERLPAPRPTPVEIEGGVDVDGVNDLDPEPALDRPVRRRLLARGGLGAAVGRGSVAFLRATWRAFAGHPPPPREPPPLIEPDDEPVEAPRRPARRLLPSGAGRVEREVEPRGDPLDDPFWDELNAEPVPPRRARRGTAHYLGGDEPEHVERPVVRAGRRPGGRRPAEGRVGPWPMLVGALVLVVVLVVGGLLFVRVMQERAVAEELARQLTEAELKEREALATTDPTVRRRLLLEAQRLVENVPPNSREATRANGVINRVVEQLDQLDGLVRLVGAIELIGPDLLGKGSSVAQFAGGGNYLFVLDNNGGSVYGYQLGPTGTEVRPLQRTPLFARGNQLGTITLGELASITWSALGGQRAYSSLICLDSSGTLVEYDPENGRTAVTTIGAGWGRVKATRSYQGNFYVLDGQTRQLLRYPASGAGITPQATSYFGPDSGIDFSAVVDFAVDGDVFLLFADGRVQRYSNGKAAPFGGTPPTTPLASASRIYTTASTKSLYIADAGNKRLVQFSKKGDFERQYVYPGPQDIFDRVEALQVDEQRGKLYVLSKGRLYVTDFPKG